MSRTSQQRRDRARASGMCSRCFAVEVKGRYKRCLRCRIKLAEKKLLKKDIGEQA